MENSWKISALCAGIAFGISVMFGIIGGVGFGTILLRAVAGAVLFAGLGSVVVVLTRRFLPELLQPDPEAGTAGEGVDIVIPDLNPHENADEYGDMNDNEYRRRASREPEEEELDGLVEEIEEIPRSELSVGDSDDDSDLVEEIDSLPDMGSFESSFSASYVDGNIEREAPPDKNEQDPALLAKVVQTILRKEKKG